MAVLNAEPGSDSTNPKLRFDVFTLFPGIFSGPLDESIMRRAQERGLVEIAIHDIRQWARDRHHTTDDTPYGGGAGMVMMAPPIVDAVEEILGAAVRDVRVLAMSAGGRLLTQDMAAELAQCDHLAIVCGRYEGIDDRAIQLLNAEEISIGDYVLTGGELPALVVMDAVSRLVPGVIEAASVAEESHQASLVEYPHFTRPASFRGLDVPPVLLSGHHAEIARWRRNEAIRRTARYRPDLIDRATFSSSEWEIVESERGSGGR